MTSYINHALLKPETVAARPYQIDLAVDASQKSTLVVIPTGLGKTIVAALVSMTRLAQGCVLLLAPTNPLLEQHVETLRRFFVDSVGVSIVNGSIKPEIRRQAFEKNANMHFIVGTPQSIANDLRAGRINLTNVSLVIFDEAHHGVGKYDYTFIAGRYDQDRRHDALSLGITASPGYDEEQIRTICDNLHLVQVRYKSEQDDTVKPYVQDTPVEFVMVDQEPELVAARTILTTMCTEALEELGLPARTAKKDLIAAQAVARTNQDRRSQFFLAKVMKLQQAIMLADTQGPRTLIQYISSLKADPSKAAESIRRDYRINQVLDLAGRVRVGEKLQAVIRLTSHQIISKPDSKILLFCSYRDTVDAVLDVLTRAADLADFRISPGVLVGQTKGMSQKKQQEALQKFRSGEINVLIATQVGEEGLDIPAVDLVIHYEPVSSGKRSTQRDGRTGRNRPGLIKIIATKKTMDEWMLVNSYRNRKNMRSALKSLEV